MKFSQYPESFESAIKIMVQPLSCSSNTICWYEADVQLGHSFTSLAHDPMYMRAIEHEFKHGRKKTVLKFGLAMLPQTSSSLGSIH